MPRYSGDTAERNARIIMAYFHPWVLDHAVSRNGVPHVTQLHSGDSTWVETMNEWLEGKIMTQESARYIRNFLSVNRMRPRDRDQEAECRSDDLISDEELELSREELAEALETRIGGKQLNAEDVDNAEVDPSEVGQFENSSSAIARAQKVWSTELTSEDVTAPRFRRLPKCLETVFKAAAASRSKDPWSKAFQPDVRQASLTVHTSPKAAEARAWLEQVKARVNAEQFDVIERVVERVLFEERETYSPPEHMSDPLMHLMHGRPGVGKSHVLLEIRQFFEQIMKWTIGVEFNIVALQAVMATALGGETLHHVAGINPFISTEGKTSSEKNQSSENLAKRHMASRWIIIDEISMVSAKLLADVDMKLRDAVAQTAHSYKVDRKGLTRSFGGMNVFFCGDFCQLDPPDGVSLASVPRDLLWLNRKVPPAGDTLHGQQLFWGDEVGLSVRSVTELTEPIRCKDRWYNEFLEECRAMNLSKDNHAFLHGEETTVSTLR